MLANPVCSEQRSTELKRCGTHCNYRRYDVRDFVTSHIECVEHKNVTFLSVT